jgi:hypothetical protein
VVKAARGFVAIRPTSYENAKEAAFLKTLFVGRSGEVENTTFALLKSDGKTRLSGISRSPAQVFGNATNMAAAMRKIHDTYRVNDKPAGSAVSPALSSVRLATNVAACDNLPLVILGPKAGPEIEKELTRLFFDSQHKGHFVMARATDSDLADLSGLSEGSSPKVVLVQPDVFGLKAEVLAQLDTDDPSKIETSVLRPGFAQFHQFAKEFGPHRTSGVRSGAFWETALPVTDPQEKRARDGHPQSRKK